jgi:hypothetical protein
MTCEVDMIKAQSRVEFFWHIHGKGEHHKACCTQTHLSHDLQSEYDCDFLFISKVLRFKYVFFAAQ